MTPSTTLSWRVWVKSQAPAAPVRLPMSDEDDREAEHEEHGAQQHPAAPARRPGRRRTGRWRRRGSPAAAGSRTGRRTRRGRRAGPPAARGSASRTEPCRWNQSLIEDRLDEARSGSGCSGCDRSPSAATRPSASSTTVLGIDRGLSVPGKDSSACRRGRRSRGRARRRCGRTRAALSSEASRMLSPTKATLSPSSAAASMRSGCSTRHGGHHEPQTLTTTGLPRRSARAIALPSRSSPVSSMGSPRSAAATRPARPSPEM